MKKTVIGVLAAVVVLIVVVFFGRNLFLPAKSTLAVMQKKMVKLESARFDGVLKLSGKGKMAGVDTSKYTGGLSGMNEKSAMEDEELTEGEITLNVSGVVGNIKDENKVLDLSVAAEFDSKEVAGIAEINIKSLDKVTYLNVGGLNLTKQDDSSSGMLDSVLDVLGTNWLKIDKLDLDNEGEEVSEEVEQMKDEDRGKAEEIQKLAEKTEFFTYSKKLGTKKMMAGLATGVSVKANKKEIKNFVLEAYKIKYDGDDYPEEKRVKMEESLEALETLEVVFWIGTSDSYLYKIEAKGNVTNEEDGTDLNIDLNLELFDHGKKVEVLAPENAMTFEDMMGQMFGAMMFSGFGSMNLDANLDSSEGSFDFEMPDFSGMNMDFNELQK